MGGAAGAPSDGQLENPDATNGAPQPGPGRPRLLPLGYGDDCKDVPAEPVAIDVNPLPSSFIFPAPPPFPYFKDRNQVIREARRLSCALEAYVINWLDGKVPAELPPSVLPRGMDPGFSHLRLVKVADFAAEDQWVVRAATNNIDYAAVHGSFPDPHATYLVMPLFYAPFGTKVIIDGEFPHARFFDIQVTPPFEPEAYHYNGGVGVGEVPLVDADMEPLPGHANPFRIGADRSAVKRGYEAAFQLIIGHGPEIEPAFRPPNFRAPGNERYAGAILYQGPWGDDKRFGHGRGVWDVGQVWVRYYAPDRDAGALGGVALPKVRYQLPDGREYYITGDVSEFARRSERTEPAPSSAPAEPAAYLGPSTGWNKEWGIFRAIVEGLDLSTGAPDWDYVRLLDKGVAGRGEDVAPPGNYEPSATSCTYISYLLRGMALGSGKVVAITGKLPTTPATRLGELMMTGAQARYWSLNAYDTTTSLSPTSDQLIGVTLHTVMDDELTLDTQRNYVLVLSRPADRPKNATAANGVTWIDWGPAGSVSWTLRWLSVSPEWSFAQAPDSEKLPYSTDIASKAYAPSLLANNNRTGFLGAYQPVVHYLSREQFESLGAPVNSSAVPLWK